MEGQDKTFVIDVESQMRMIKAAWDDFKAKHKLKTDSDTADVMFFPFFAEGYAYGMKDLYDINTGVSKIEELLKKQS